MLIFDEKQIIEAAQNMIKIIYLKNRKMIFKQIDLCVQIKKYLNFLFYKINGTVDVYFVNVFVGYREELRDKSPFLETQ